MKALMCPRCGCGAFVIGIDEKINVYVICIDCDKKMIMDTQ